MAKKATAKANAATEEAAEPKFSKEFQAGFEAGYNQAGRDYKIGQMFPRNASRPERSVKD